MSSISVVGAAITNRPIVAVGSTFVQIGAASTSPSIIGIGTVVNFSTIDFDAPLKHRNKDDFGTFSLDNNYLRFEPNDSFNIDYDVKLIKSRFNTILPGIGTNPIGFINLTGSNKSIGSGITTSILSVQSNQFSSLYTNIQIVNQVTNAMNFAEVYLTHNKDINSLSTTINSTVGIGSTVIFVADTTGLIVGVSSISVVGVAITNIPIVAVGSTFIQIGAASTSPSIIGIGTVVNFDTIIDNTYISEYYFDSEFSSNYYSGNNIGIFTASISPSGILSLNYISNSSNPVNIRSKIVGFGTTSVGTGVYRFISPGQIPGNERSVAYQ